MICHGFLPSRGLIPGAFRGCGVGFWGSTAAPQAVLGWDWGDGGSHGVGAFWGSDSDAAVLERYLGPVMCNGVAPVPTP